uniref:GAF domain-containing protein n=1 Tax=Geobacter sp. (strain M21) TaxID=443144 RepID=C6E9E7_GEOSM
MKLEEICAKLDALLATRPGAAEKVESAVDALCRIFTVERNEVAIFALDRERDAFSFIWPDDLRKSGSIPFTADRSLLAITARQRRGSLNNNFASTPHLFVFESFGKEKTGPIQRIMSAPMLKGEELAGVVQVCRKGPDADASVRRFTEPELAALCAIANVLARHL